VKKAELLVLIIISSTLVSPVASATSLDANQLNVVRQNCTMIQKTLHQVQSSDKVARINRGRMYESVIKLLTTLNSRVALNNFSLPVLTDTTLTYENEFGGFKKDYNAYEDLTQSVQTMKCSQSPQKFYDRLNQVRSARNELANKVKLMNSLLNVYDEGLIMLEQQIVSKKINQSPGVPQQ
jgi:hypothetical protein